MFTAKAIFDKNDTRYSRKWASISFQAKEMVNWCCVMPGCPNKAEQTHHAVRYDLRGSVFGREEFGVHIFPLCTKCHQTAHLEENWKIDPDYPDLGERNTKEFRDLLKQGWNDKLSIKVKIFGHKMR